MSSNWAIPISNSFKLSTSASLSPTLPGSLTGTLRSSNLAMKHNKSPQTPPVLYPDLTGTGWYKAGALPVYAVHAYSWPHA